MATRREFLKAAAIAGAGLILIWQIWCTKGVDFAQSPGVRKFRDLSGNPIPPGGSDNRDHAIQTSVGALRRALQPQGWRNEYV